MEELPSQDSKVSFEDIAAKKGYSPEFCPRFQNDIKNVTHILKAKGKSNQPLMLKFDVKKLKNKKQSQSWLWIEFKNSEGERGWIHGDADFIAFERVYDFVIVNRKELVDWLGSSKKIRYDLPFVSLAKQAKYKIYKRRGKKEEITQIGIKDLESLKSFQLWKK
jgi:hypothetical protein